MTTQPLRVAINAAHKATILAQVQARLTMLSAMQTPDDEARLNFINNLDDGLERVNKVLEAMLESLDLYEASQYIDHLERCYALEGNSNA